MHPHFTFLLYSKKWHLLDTDIFKIENSRHLNPTSLKSNIPLMWTSDKFIEVSPVIRFQRLNNVEFNCLIQQENVAYIHVLNREVPKQSPGVLATNLAKPSIHA